MVMNIVSRFHSCLLLVFISILYIIFKLLLPHPAFAEIETFVKEYWHKAKIAVKEVKLRQSRRPLLKFQQQNDDTIIEEQTLSLKRQDNLSGCMHGRISKAADC